MLRSPTSTPLSIKRAEIAGSTRFAVVCSAWNSTRNTISPRWGPRLSSRSRRSFIRRSCSPVQEELDQFGRARRRVVEHRLTERDDQRPEPAGGVLGLMRSRSGRRRTARRSRRWPAGCGAPRGCPLRRASTGCSRCRPCAAARVRRRPHALLVGQRRVDRPDRPFGGLGVDDPIERRPEQVVLVGERLEDRPLGDAGGLAQLATRHGHTTRREQRQDRSDDRVASLGGWRGDARPTFAWSCVRRHRHDSTRTSEHTLTHEACSLLRYRPDMPSPRPGRTR